MMNLLSTRHAARQRSYAWMVLVAYILFLMLPLYWLLMMSFKTNQEILSTFSLWPL